MSDDHVHKLDVCCMLCVKNKIEQLEKLKKFVKQIALNPNVYWHDEAMKLLREIEDAK